MTVYNVIIVNLDEMEGQGLGAVPQIPYCKHNSSQEEVLGSKPGIFREKNSKFCFLCKISKIKIFAPLLPAN